jgi:hypothetical protein
MGWVIEIKVSPALEESVVDDMIEELPATLQSCHGKTFCKQKWGWLLYADVTLTDYGLQLRGSYTQSGKFADVAAWAFEQLLKQRGYKVEVGKLR